MYFLLHFILNNPVNGYTIIESLLIIIFTDNLQNGNAEAFKILS